MITSIWTKLAALVVTLAIFAATIKFWGWDTYSQFGLSILAGLYVSLLFLQPKDRQKHVHFVAKANTTYSNLVLDGFRSQLSKSIALEVHQPSLEESESTRWQVATLQKIDKTKLDVLVLVPAGHSDELVDILIDLRRKGIQVVLIDYKFKNMHFIDRELLPPQFVFADPLTTGNLLGGVVDERINAGVNNLIFLLGSRKSAVALYRTQSIALRALRASGTKPIKTSLVELDAWTFDETVKANLFTNLERVHDAGEKAIVICANDAVMDEVDRSLPEKFLGTVELIGCDGGRRQDGRSILETTRTGIATVDINARGQGEIAADIVNSKLDRGKSKRRGYHVRRVEQILLRK